MFYGANRLDLKYWYNMRAQIVNSFIGIWLMVAPAIFHYENTAAGYNDRIVGPIIAAFAIIACFQITRIVRKFNIPLAVWLLVAPWILGHEHTAAIITDLASGIVVLGLSFIKGKVEHKYGGGWTSLWKSNTLHESIARKIKATQRGQVL
jgi:hypothetical protein